MRPEPYKLWLNRNRKWFEKKDGEGVYFSLSLSIYGAIDEDLHFAQLDPLAEKSVSRGGAWTGGHEG